MALLLDEKKDIQTLTKITSINPGTLEVLAEVDITQPDEILYKVKQAKIAFVEWSALSISERSKFISRASDYIMENLERIAELISKENGKPVVESITADIMPVLELMDYSVRNAEHLLQNEKLPLGKWSTLNKKSYVEYTPLGVVGIISPWNFPFSIPMGQIVTALLAGNTVILKHSEQTPIIGLEIESIFRKSGIPAEVFSVITGFGNTGATLVNSGVNKIVFTGSVNTGKKVMAAAAQTLTPVVLELGGKDPMIVLPDVNIDYAVSGAVWGAFSNSGQICASIERAYVHESIADEFIYEVTRKTNMLKQGLGLDRDVELGPMISMDQLRIVESHVEDARQRGAKILTGGMKHPDLPGFFYKPTVLTNVDHSFRIVKEETFGPILPIMTFKDEDEVIQKANDSKYGLTASIWTKDIERAQRIASKLETGTVSINDCLSTFALCQTPWGGQKDSGIGRTHGKFGFMEFVQPRHVHIDSNYNTKKFWWFNYNQNRMDMFENFLKLMFTGSKVSSVAKFLKNFAKNEVM